MLHIEVTNITPMKDLFPELQLLAIIDDKYAYRITW